MLFIYILQPGKETWKYYQRMNKKSLKLPILTRHSKLSNTAAFLTGLVDEKLCTFCFVHIQDNHNSSMETQGKGQRAKYPKNYHEARKRNR